MTEQRYDSRADTWKHIHQVRHNLTMVVNCLLARMMEHDQSKLVEPELSYFDEHTPKLAATTYGSDDYKKNMQAMKPAIEHHNAVNRHHPEHWPNGVDDMTLLDLIEMLMDWKAATMRHNDGNIVKSIEYNQARFNISPQLVKIFKNTIKELGME